VELRLAWAGFLVFVALLPVQVSVRLPFGSRGVALFPGDVALFASVAAFAFAVVRRAARPRLGGFGIAVCAFLACALPSVLFSESPGRSAVKWSTAVVYAAAALVTVNLVDSEVRLRHTARAWILGTVVTVVVGLATVALFYLGLSPALVAELTSDYGSLAPGHYPRVGALFYQRQPNSLCHYLSISLLLVCGAAGAGWVGRRAAVLLGLGVLIVAAFTQSFGLGGIALGLGWWLASTPDGRVPSLVRRGALALGVTGALVFAVLIVMAPVADRSDRARLPFSFQAAPSGRVVCWGAAWEQFTAHPLVGRGMGLHARCPPYAVPSGYTALLEDAHSMYLSLASTQGLLGLVSFAAIVWTLLRPLLPMPGDATPAASMARALGIAFVQSCLYQGLAASFEFTRHGWVLMGLLWATLELARRTGRAPAHPSG
jgi:O-antigen ligase